MAMVYYTDGREERALGPGGVEAMAALMTEAFMAHANWRALIPDERRRLRALRALFRFMGGVAARYGRVVVVFEDGRAVGYITFMDEADRIQVSPMRVALTGGLPAALRFALCLRPAELAVMRAFGDIVQERYAAQGGDSRGLHLYTAAVEVASQGRGVMRRAFGFFEHRFKALGLRYYELETTDPANIPVYLALGMVASGEATLPGGRGIWFFKKEL